MMNRFATHEVTDKETWEQFVLRRPEANFLQSWNWGVFHERLGKKVWRIGIFAGTQQIGGALCVREEAKRGTYLTIAGGPLVDWTDQGLLIEFFYALAALARKHHCQFIRLRPQVIDTPALREMVRQLGLRESPMHLTADLTLQLDLTKTEDQLLTEMRKNTRYDIRRAEREGVAVRTSTDPDDVKSFYETQLALAKKHDFVPFSFAFLDQQFRTFVADNQAVLFHAYKEKELLASAFIIFYHGEAVYHYGISTPANDRLPGAYACQWAAIRWAKSHGGLRYNFWGVAPTDKPDHRFAGVSLFKRGFGGEEVQYLPAHDLPVSWKYGVTRFFETVRKKRRKL